MIVVLSLPHVLALAAEKIRDESEPLPMKLTEAATIVESISPPEGCSFSTAHTALCQPRWRADHGAILHVVMHVGESADYDVPFLIACKYEFTAERTLGGTTVQPRLTLKAVSTTRTTICDDYWTSTHVIDSITHNGRGFVARRRHDNSDERLAFTLARLHSEDGPDTEDPPFKAADVLVTPDRSHFEPYSGALVFDHQIWGSQEVEVTIQYFD